jgi:outer membrane protein assembly factor BamB
MLAASIGRTAMTTLAALDLATGALRWVVTAPAGDFARPMGPMASDGERIFVLAGVVKPRLSALDVATGATLWSFPRSTWTHSPIVSNGVLYLATDLHLKALDPASGADLPIAPLTAMRWGELVIAQGHSLISGGPVRAFGLAP